MSDLARHSDKLYELTAEYDRVLNLLDAIDADPGALEAELDSIAGKIQQKAGNIAALIRQFEAMASLRMGEVRRMKELADADGRRADRLRDYLLRNMQAINTELIHTAAFHIQIRQNPPSVQVVDEQQIPDEFFRVVTTRSVDKKAILATLKDSGEVVDGVEVVRGQRLEIR